MPVPVFSTGEVLTAAAMNAVGLWRVTTCTVTSAGGTAATASNGVVTVGTGNTSVTVNNAFSADYARYRVTIDGVLGSLNGDMRIQIGTAIAQYYGIYNYQTPAGGGALGILPQTATADAYIGGLNTTFHEQSISFDIINPNKALRTSWTGQAFGNNYYFSFGYQLADATQHTSFKIFPSAGTITGGEICVYGYNN